MSTDKSDKPKFPRILTPEDSADALAAGREARERAELAKSARLIDRFGRPILVGGEYLINSRYIPSGVVTDVSPVLDPKALPGTFKVTVIAEHVYFATHQQRVVDLTLVNMPPELMEEPTPPADPTGVAGEGDAKAS